MAANRLEQSDYGGTGGSGFDAGSGASIIISNPARASSTGGTVDMSQIARGGNSGTGGNVTSDKATATRVAGALLSAATAVGLSAPILYAYRRCEHRGSGDAALMCANKTQKSFASFLQNRRVFFLERKKQRTFGVMVGAVGTALALWTSA